MKIALNKSVIWGLVNPINTEEVLLWLTLGSPSAEIDYDKLPKWGQHLLHQSVLSKYVSVDQELPELELTEKKTVRKKIAKKKAKKKVSKKTTGRRR